MVALKGSPSRRYQSRCFRWSSDSHDQQTRRMTPMFCPLPTLSMLQSQNIAYPAHRQTFRWLVALLALARRTVAADCRPNLPTIPWNGCPRCRGTAAHDHLESAPIIPWNTQSIRGMCADWAASIHRACGAQKFGCSSDHYKSRRADRRLYGGDCPEASVGRPEPGPGFAGTCHRFCCLLQPSKGVWQSEPLGFRTRALICCAASMAIRLAKC